MKFFVIEIVAAIILGCSGSQGTSVTSSEQAEDEMSTDSDALDRLIADKPFLETISSHQVTDEALELSERATPSSEPDEILNESQKAAFEICMKNLSDESPPTTNIADSITKKEKRAIFVEAFSALFQLPKYTETRFRDQFSGGARADGLWANITDGNQSLWLKDGEVERRIQYSGSHQSLHSFSGRPDRISNKKKGTAYQVVFLYAFSMFDTDHGKMLLLSDDLNSHDSVVFDLDWNSDIVKALGTNEPDDEFIAKHGSWKFRQLATPCGNPLLVVALVKHSTSWRIFGIYGDKPAIWPKDICLAIATTTEENQSTGVSEVQSSCAD